ncbi:ABC transporter permease [Amycolatopsis sp. BJA-103]|uniref:ABC transporter permease n=1 Tax=unclassified Amycolatopsis TaxID=2618356 RepID=UPI000C776E0A|nr:ABC transporter permease [Amycolatopsis sp. BJA-103]AUI60845.1 ABC transporter permease [Amycolatopsis sp. BJA-103]PNE21870.1 ABC transporter permease [Amycolatopsis sp. BJA-103]
MLWLTYRQHRMQLLITAGLLVVVGILLLINGNAAADSLDPAKLFKDLYTYLSWLQVVPVAIGVFWGAPLVAAEFERGTTKLAWTQSISRFRWLGVKLGFLAVLATLGGLAFGAMMQRWVEVFPTDRGDTAFTSRFDNPVLFAMTGVAPGAWWLFGFVLGTAAGALLRKTLPAIAVTIAVTVGLMIGVSNFRDSYAEPELVPLSSEPTGRVVEMVRDAAGEITALKVLPQDWYWRFQWTEAAILTGVSLLLVVAATFAIRRRS